MEATPKQRIALNLRAILTGNGSPLQLERARFELTDDLMLPIFGEPTATEVLSILRIELQTHALEMRRSRLAAEVAERNDRLAVPETDRTDTCRHCGSAIHQAADGAWEDARGACGCGDEEHEPGGRDERSFGDSDDLDWLRRGVERWGHCSQ